MFPLSTRVQVNGKGEPCQVMCVVHIHTYRKQPKHWRNRWNHRFGRGGHSLSSRALGEQTHTTIGHSLQLPQLVSRRNKTLWMRLQRGYMVQSQFDAPMNSSSVESLETAYIPTYSSKTSGMRSESSTHLRNESMVEASRSSQPLVTPTPRFSMMSTASTLVAEDGSNAPAAPGLRPFRLKVNGLIAALMYLHLAESLD